MSADTVLYRDAVILVGGALINAQLRELNVNYAAEMLDRTAFGDTTKNRRGGLFVVDIDGKGFVATGTGAIEDLLFGDVGAGDLPVVVFPNGVTEGSQVARGYATLAQMESFKIGGTAGQLLPLDFKLAGAGLSVA